jgi:hypothetical protein
MKMPRDAAGQTLQALLSCKPVKSFAPQAPKRSLRMSARCHQSSTRTFR